MKKLSKRAIAFLMALCMVLALNVSSVFADTPTSNESTATYGKAKIGCSVSWNGRYMTVYVDYGDGTTKPASNIRVAVWSADGGQDDLQWYKLTSEDATVFTADIDLMPHGREGVYYAHVYCDDNTLMAAFEKNVDMSKAEIKCEISKDGRTMTVTADYAYSARPHDLKVAVWSNTNGQDDLQWYKLTSSDATSYMAVIDLTAHGSSDTYYAHVYEGSTMLQGFEEKVEMSSKANPDGVTLYCCASDYVTLRSMTSRSSSALAKITTREEMTKLDEVGDWYYVNYKGTLGYVLKEFASTDKNAALNYGTGSVSTDKYMYCCASDYVTVRLQPSKTADPIDRIYSRQRVIVVEDKGEWLYVDYEIGNGNFAGSGYVLKSYFSTSQDAPLNYGTN